MQANQRVYRFTVIGRPSNGRRSPFARAASAAAAASKQPGCGAYGWHQLLSLAACSRSHSRLPTFNSPSSSRSNSGSHPEPVIAS